MAKLMNLILEHMIPTKADLDAVTAACEATLADPSADREERLTALRAEETVHNLYLQRPGADAVLQAEAEQQYPRGT